MIQLFFEVFDLGDQGVVGSIYVQEVCDIKVIIILMGVVMLDGSIWDNMVMLIQEFCGVNSYIVVKINEVSGGYVGIFFRNGINEDDVVVGIFKGEGIVYQLFV